MTQIYDEEVEKMRVVGFELQKKYDYMLNKMPAMPLYNKTARKMVELWHDEAVKRYADIGWVVEVDITPALAGIGVPVISVVEPIEQRAFDHEKKQAEVLKSRELGGI